MKRLLTTALAIVIAAIMCSCGVLITPVDETNTQTVIVPTEAPSRTPYLTVEPDKPGFVSGYTPSKPAYSYDAMPLEGEKALYTELLDIIHDISDGKDELSGMYAMPQVKISYPLSEAQVRTVIKALYDDNPEFFWTSGTIGYYSGGEETVVQLYSKYSPEEIDSRLDKLGEAADRFYASIPSGLSDYDLELMAHDYIIELVEYDKNVDTDNVDNNDPDIYTVYGALVNNKAVCEGYARAMQYLLRGVGVDCVGISGVGSEELHMWNAVKLNGKWYEVDATWDDHDEPYNRYAYFNLTNEQMRTDHTLTPMFDKMTDNEINGMTGDINCDVMNMFVPECTDGTMGYYYRSSPRYTGSGVSELTDSLLTAAKAQDEIYIFYIDDSLDFDESLRTLFTDEPQLFFDCVSEVNSRLENYSIDSSHLGYYPFKKTRIAAVELHYY